MIDVERLDKLHKKASQDNDVYMITAYENFALELTDAWPEIKKELEGPTKTELAFKIAKLTMEAKAGRELAEAVEQLLNGTSKGPQLPWLTEALETYKRNVE